MQLKTIILINILLTFFEIKEINSFKCGSKNLNITPGILDNEIKIKKRRIQEGPETNKDREEEENEKFQKLNNPSYL